MSAGAQTARHRDAGQVLSALLPTFLLAAALLLVFSRLRHPAAVLELWRPWAETGALACGMTAVIVTGGIDLSVGALTGLCGVVLGLTRERLGWPIELACAAAVLAGAAAGTLNGALVALGIAPLVATLATMACFSGLALALSGGEPITGFPASFTRMGQGNLFGVPCQLWLLAVSALFWGVLLHHSRMGRALYAIGDNRTAAVFAALPVRRRLWQLYALNGLLVGLIALSYTSRSGAAVPNAGQGLELQVIAAVVLGGARPNGGAGGIVRTLLGVAVLAHLEIGLRLLGNIALHVPGTRLTIVLNTNGRFIVIGTLFIAVAVLNERVARSRRRP
jgi:ribose/xylose/arabinose/galactoside ABC-type transport system permease subunit